jgi:hypothetical protein
METGEFPALFQGKVGWRLKSRLQQSKSYKYGERPGPIGGRR